MFLNKITRSFMGTRFTERYGRLTNVSWMINSYQPLWGFRSYIKVELKRHDKRERRRKPGTHRETPKPPTAIIAKQLQKLQLTEKSPVKNPYNVQNRKIFGRGGGRSRYCRRGDKGFKVRHSVKTPLCIDYAGGKPPYETSIAPKIGKVEEKIKNKLHITTISFNKLKKSIDAGIIDHTKKINLKTFVECKFLPEYSCGVRLLVDGMYDFHYKVDIEVNEAPKAVIERIKFLGGKVNLVCIDKDRLEYYRNPKNFFFEPLRALPCTPTGLRLYSDPNGGFLSEYISKDDSLESSIKKLKELHLVRLEIISKKLLSLPSESNTSIKELNQVEKKLLRILI